MEDEFDAKGIIIDLLDKSNLNQEQINNTIKELIEFYNLEYFVRKKFNECLCEDCKESVVSKFKLKDTCEFCKADLLNIA